MITGKSRVLFESVSVPFKDASVALAEGNVIVVPSVPESEIELLAVSVFPLAIVKVAEDEGAVIATLLMDVAVATPSVGVVRVGDVKVLLVIVSVPVSVTSVSHPEEDLISNRSLVVL